MVDLPEALGPSMVTYSPALTESDKRSSTVRPAKVLVIPSSSSAGRVTMGCFLTEPKIIPIGPYYIAVPD